MLLTEVGGGERHSFVEVVAEVPDHAAHDGGAADLELDVANSSGGRVDSRHSDLPIYPQLEHILDNACFKLQTKIRKDFTITSRRRPLQVLSKVLVASVMLERRSYI